MAVRQDIKRTKVLNKEYIMCAHLHCGHCVVVVDVQVTLSIVGNHNTCHLTVHPKVRVSVSDEHQQAHGVVPPAYLVLWGDTTLRSTQVTDKTTDESETFLKPISPHKQLPAWWRQSHTRGYRCLQIHAAWRWSRWTCRCCSSETKRVYIQRLAGRLGRILCNAPGGEHKCEK